MLEKCGIFSGGGIYFLPKKPLTGSGSLNTIFSGTGTNIVLNEAL